LSNTELTGNGLGCGAIITRHHYYFDAKALKLLYRLGSIFLDRVSGGQ
jgi:hypothetical protein